MACSDFVYAEDTLDYIIGSYRGDNYVMETYEPDCCLLYTSPSPRD